MLADGQTLRGRVVRETRALVVLRVGTHDQEFPRAQVKSVESIPRRMREWLARSAKADPADAAAHVALADWCAKEGLARMAALERWRAIAADPASPAAAAAHRGLSHPEGPGGFVVPFEKSFLPLAEVEKRRAEWRDAWVLATEHYEVRTNLPLAAACAAAVALESFHARFFEVLAERVPIEETLEPLRAHVHRTAESLPKIRIGEEGRAHFNVRGDHIEVCGEPRAAPAPGDPAEAISATPGGVEYAALFHEATHQLLERTFRRTRSGRGDVPTWCDEGLADYLAGHAAGPFHAISHDTARRCGWHFRVQAEADEKERLPLERVLTLSTREYYGGPGMVLKYAASYSLVHFSLEGDGGKYRDAFFTFLVECHRGQGSPQAFRRLVARPEDEFERSWKIHDKTLAGASGRRAAPGGRPLPPAAPAAPTVKREAAPPKDAPFTEVRRRALAALGAEDFLTRREGLSWLAGRPEAEAPILVLDALARYPVDADAAERRTVTLADRILWREAVVETLATFRAEAAFWTLVAPASADARGWETVCAVLDALGEIAESEPKGAPGIARRAGLASAIAARLGAGSAIVRAAAARALGRLGSSEVPVPVEGLVPLFADTAWPVRLRAIEATGRLRTEAAVEPLIEALARETGRVREAAQTALLAVTAADVPDDPDLWRIWLKARRETGSLVGKRGKGPGTQRAPRFYGIPVTGSRVVFVVDTTGSMLRRHDAAAVARWLARDAELGRPPYKGANFLDLAKYELSNAVRELPATTSFSIVTFSSDLVKVWQPALVRATAEAKAEALAFADALGGGGGTNLYDGLVKAFELADRQSADFATGPDTVLLFTDGEVNMGTRTNPGEIRSILRALHGLRHVRVHTIGLGTYDTEMLRGLAEDSGGTFVDVPIPVEARMGER